MREMASSILKIGMINSGMFDTLEINTDVRAVHLVGDNNVGKTSLIEIIQFLYFPDLRDMHFSKSQTETLAFYFRREGSYILFTIRNVHGKQRTLGVYGTGTAHTRQVFAFDGSFTLTDFLDEQHHVLSPQNVGIHLADRRFYIYQRVEDHERGLIGEQSEDAANIHLFDMGRDNFRLLRRLLQNLLRLERLTDRDIRLFLNALVESTGAKTRIDVARDFERKYADARNIRERINSLQRLKPLIDQWITANTRLTQAKNAEHAARLRLYYAAQCYATLLEEQQRDLSGRISTINVALNELEEQRQRLANQIAKQNSRKDELQRTLDELQNLIVRCSGRQREEVRTERDGYTYRAIELQKRIDQSSNVSVAQIESRLRRDQEERERIRRQIASRTISHLLVEASLSDEQHALLRFLISERLLSLPLADSVADASQLLAAAHAAASQVDPQGNFHGFGLNIARHVWDRPITEEESLTDRLAEIEQRIASHELELKIARDREQAQQEIRSLQHQADELDKLLGAFDRLAMLEASSGGVASVERALETCEREQKDLEAQQGPLGERVRGKQHEHVELQSQQRALQQHLNEVRQVVKEIGNIEDPCPTDIADLAAAELPRTFDQNRGHYHDQRSERKRAEEALHNPRTQLDHLYEREAPELPFEQWVDEKHRLTAEVERLETQLHESYTNLFTLAKGELDKLTQAFEVVRSRVAELNNSIRRVSISNIERIEIQVQESQLVEAIRQTSRAQLDMFTPITGNLSLEEAEQKIEEHLANTLRAHGHELNLDNLFHLEFRVTYAQTGEQRTVTEIHSFESNGTAIGVKIVVYLGLIRLLQGNRRSIVSRIPFFLDEVGSLSSNNVRQIIAYCAEHNFLPIFASPTMRSDIPHSYILQRDGDRSRLVNEVILTEREHTDAATRMDHAAR